MQASCELKIVSMVALEVTYHFHSTASPDGCILHPTSRVIGIASCISFHASRISFHRIPHLLPPHPASPSTAFCISFHRIPHLIPASHSTASHSTTYIPHLSIPLHPASLDSLHPASLITAFHISCSFHSTASHIIAIASFITTTVSCNTAICFFSYPVLATYLESLSSTWHLRQ